MKQPILWVVPVAVETDDGLELVVTLGPFVTEEGAVRQYNAMLAGTFSKPLPPLRLVSPERIVSDLADSMETRESRWRNAQPAGGAG